MKKRFRRLRPVSRRYRTSVVRANRFRAFPWRLVLTIAGAAVGVILLALIIGGLLARRSEAQRRDEDALWTLSPEEETRPDVTVPAFRGRAIRPWGSLAGIASDGLDNGVTLNLSIGDDGSFPYTLAMADAAGLTSAPDAPPLSAEVQRLHSAGLRVCGVFNVECMNMAYAADPAAAAFRRGVELSVLTAIAGTGIDEVLLVGLPAGTDAADSLSRAYLSELRRLIDNTGKATLIGVVMKPACFALRPEELNDDGTPKDGTAGAGDVLYGGRLTPGRMLSACDYLVLDLRTYAGAENADALEDLLSHIRYAYARYGLRLLYAEGDDAVSGAAYDHGFDRLMGTDLAPAKE